MQCKTSQSPYLEGIVGCQVVLNASSFSSQERDLGDEYGWKQVHGDVFRPATYPMLFSALIGTGYQTSIVSLCVITFAILGELYTEYVYRSLFPEKSNV